MRIEADSRGPIRRIALRGEVDNLNAEALSSHLVRIAGEPPCLVVLDLRDLSLVTSAGLGRLIGFVKTVRAAEGQVALARATKLVRRTAERLGLSEILPVVDTVEDAARLLAPGRVETAAPTRRAVAADRHLLGATGVLFRPEAEERVPEDRRAHPANGRIEERGPDRLAVAWLPSDFGATEREFGARDVDGALAAGAHVRVVYRSEGGGREAFDDRHGRIERVERRDDGWVRLEVELLPEE